MSSLGHNYKLLIPGSNGLIQALVANGNDRVAGGITTSMGVPQGAFGVMLVLGAGGHDIKTPRAGSSSPGLYFLLTTLRNLIYQRFGESCKSIRSS